MGTVSANRTDAQKGGMVPDDTSGKIQRALRRIRSRASGTSSLTNVPDRAVRPMQVILFVHK
jgi:hypothetical protein